VVGGGYFFLPSLTALEFLTRRSASVAHHIAAEQAR